MVFNQPHEGYRDAVPGCQYETGIFEQLFGIVSGKIFKRNRCANQNESHRSSVCFRPSYCLIAGEVAREFGVMQEELYFRRASCGVARSVFMELCRLYLGRKMSLAEIGRKVGDISASAFTQNRKRLAAKMQDDALLRQRFQKLRDSWDR